MSRRIQASAVIALLVCGIVVFTCYRRRRPAPVSLPPAVSRSPADGWKQKGAAEARRDIARGIRKIKAHGLPNEWIGEFGLLLEKRCGARMDPVAGCVVTEQLENEVEGYNAVMAEELRRRFGPDILDRLENEASRRCQVRRAQGQEADEPGEHK